MNSLIKALAPLVLAFALTGCAALIPQGPLFTVHFPDPFNLQGNEWCNLDYPFSCGEYNAHCREERAYWEGRRQACLERQQEARQRLQAREEIIKRRAYCQDGGQDCPPPELLEQPQH